MARKDYPSVDHVRQCVRYEDGRLFWLERPRTHFKDERAWKTWNARFAGFEAGTLQHGRDFRWKIGLSGSSYKQVHRALVVWALFNGNWPSGKIDHNNRNSLDDRIENLRLVSKSQDCMNRCANKKRKYGRLKGAFFDARQNRWFSSIKMDGKSYYLGSFSNEEEAHQAYVEASEVFFGEFAYVG
jgi:hypothetical protein